MEEQYSRWDMTHDWESIRRAIDSNPIRKEYRPWSEVYYIQGYKMTQEQQDAMHKEVYGPMIEAENQIFRNNKAIMKEVYKQVSRSRYWGICTYIKDLKENCYYTETMMYEIVDKPGGVKQKESWSKDLQELYVDQWSVGCEGDSYEGYVYLPVTENKWLKINYAM